MPESLNRAARNTAEPLPFVFQAPSVQIPAFLLVFRQAGRQALSGYPRCASVSSLRVTIITMVSLPHLNSIIPEKDIPTPLFRSVSYGVVIRCEIIFGSPSMDCRGTGICKIISTEELTGITDACARFPAYIASRRDACGLLLFFSKDQLSDTAFSRHFPENTLGMNEECPVPEFIRTGLKTDINNLSAGSYSLQTDGNYVFVSIDASMRQG